MEEADKQSDPDDIYASINWEDNPPINGFYEMMMDMTPESARLFGKWRNGTGRNNRSTHRTTGGTRYGGEKQEEVLDMKPRPYHRTPEMHLREGSLVANRARDIGYLKDITPYGATFQPIGLTGYQKKGTAVCISP